MKKFKIAFILILLFCANSIYADVPVIIEINNVIINGGLVYIRVYFGEVSLRAAKPERLITIEPNNVTLTHELQLPIGEYLIAIHQDTNGNGYMDYNFLRIPQEPYGFSNLRGKIPGNFNQMKQKISNPNERIIIPFITY